MKDFISTHAIVCPDCKMKQTGIMRAATAPVTLIPDFRFDKIRGTRIVSLNTGTPYIRCAYTPCQKVIIGYELEEVIRDTVKGPSDINDIKKSHNRSF